MLEYILSCSWFPVEWWEPFYTQTEVLHLGMLQLNPMEMQIIICKRVAFVDNYLLIIRYNNSLHENKMQKSKIQMQLSFLCILTLLQKDVNRILEE